MSGYGLKTNQLLTGPNVLANASSAASSAANVIPCSVTNKEKRDAILKKYCDIIEEQRGKIIVDFNTSFDNFLDKSFKAPNDETLCKFINDILFLQMKKSILDNYYVQNSIVIHMFQDETIKGFLKEAFNKNKPDKTNIFNTFISICLVNF